MNNRRLDRIVSNVAHTPMCRMWACLPIKNMDLTVEFMQTTHVWSFVKGSVDNITWDSFWSSVDSHISECCRGE